VLVETNSGRRALRAEQFIDASGVADILHFAGVPYDLPNSRVMVPAGSPVRRAIWRPCSATSGRNSSRPMTRRRYSANSHDGKDRCMEGIDGRFMRSVFARSSSHDCRVCCADRLVMA